MPTLHASLRRFLSFALLSLGAIALAAQEPGAAAPPDGLRPYWHVFIAYAIAIVFVMGWAISIARRLGEVEDRLSE